MFTGKPALLSHISAVAFPCPPALSFISWHTLRACNELFYRITGGFPVWILRVKITALWPLKRVVEIIFRISMHRNKQKLWLWYFHEQLFIKFESAHIRKLTVIFISWHYPLKVRHFIFRITWTPRTPSLATPPSRWRRRPTPPTSWTAPRCVIGRPNSDFFQNPLPLWMAYSWWSFHHFPVGNRSYAFYYEQRNESENSAIIFCEQNKKN